MSGVFYGAFLVAILLVIRWAMVNDMGSGQGHTGFFAMTNRRKKDAPMGGPRSRFRRTESPK